MTERILRALRAIGDVPGVRQWRQRKFDKRFEAGLAVGCCRGILETYAQAASAATTSLPLGYDHADAANMHRDRAGAIFPSDYPVMLWLKNAFANGARDVLDLRGHIGIAYYAYQKAISFPEDLSWKVYDVPAVLASGRKEALQRDPSGHMTSAEDFSSASNGDVLFTSGCIQYLEGTLAQRINALARKPDWVLVNKLPLHTRRDYWTVQSIGTAFCAYHIQQCDQLYSGMKELGYRVLDNWENLETDCWIAFEPAHCPDRYQGAAFRLA
jgi:putative methyltransferase (TIGR04325 family)